MKNLKFQSTKSNDIIEILAFNFDGNGAALVRINNTTIEGWDLEEIKLVIFGPIGALPDYTEVK